MEVVDIIELILRAQDVGGWSSENKTTPDDPVTLHIHHTMVEALGCEHGASRMAGDGCVIGLHSRATFVAGRQLQALTTRFDLQVTLYHGLLDEGVRGAILARAQDLESKNSTALSRKFGLAHVTVELSKVLTSPADGNHLGAHAVGDEALAGLRAGALLPPPADSPRRRLWPLPLR